MSTPTSKVFSPRERFSFSVDVLAVLNEQCEFPMGVNCLVPSILHMRRFPTPFPDLHVFSKSEPSTSPMMLLP
jgi:hypothetical protein